MVGTTRFQYGEISLHSAVRKKGNLIVVKGLLASGAVVNKTDNFGETPLYSAIRSNSGLEVVKALLAAGADVNGKDTFQNTLLHHVQDADVARELLSRGLSVNAVNVARQTPLHVALKARKGNALIEELLSSGADVNKKEGNALFTAVRYNSELPVIVSLLEAPGADVHCQDISGGTLLHHVRSADVARELMSRGLSAKAKSKEWPETVFQSLALKISMQREHEMHNCEFFQAPLQNERSECDLCRLKELAWTLVLGGADIRSEVCSYLSSMVVETFKTWANFFIKVALIKSSFDVLEGSVDVTFYTSYLNNLKTLAIRRNLSWIETFLDCCDREISLIQGDTIFANVSLYTFFYNSWNSEKVIPLYSHYDKIEENIVTKYPIYREMLLPKIKKCFERSALLIKLKTLNIYTIKSENNVINLQYYILRIIAENLSNNDLANLIKCATDEYYSSEG